MKKEHRWTKSFWLRIKIPFFITQVAFLKIYNYVIYIYNYLTTSEIFLKNPILLINLVGHHVKQNLQP